jgi:hypothetical protein
MKAVFKFFFILSLTKTTAMRKLILLTIFLPISFILKAQAHEGSIEYNKGKQACIVMEYNYPAEAVENAMRAKLLKLGYGGKEEKGMFNKDKGFRVYKETTVGEISPNKYDYAINIERKSHKEADESSGQISSRITVTASNPSCACPRSNKLRPGESRAAGLFGGIFVVYCRSFSGG